MGFPVYDYRCDLRNVLVSPQIRSRFLRLEPGQPTQPHTHDLGHEVFLVLQGRALFDLVAGTEPRSYMHVINRAGHFSYRENPDHFNNLIEGFVQSA